MTLVHPQFVSPRMEEQPSQRRRRKPSRKPSAFENTIDDLTMKRLGRGSIYYGKREAFDEEQQSQIDDSLKPDSVLVTGATGRTGLWIALGLTNQQFNVRCLTRNFDKAEKIFGPSGSNLDIFEGDITDAADVYDAVDGSKAIICASGAPWWLPGGHQKVDRDGVQNLVNAAKKCSTVERFVLISCVDDRSSRASAKRMAESIVIKSGIPYVILRAGALNDAEGGVKKIVLSTDIDDTAGTAELSRVDLAQSVCQALVYERRLSKLREEDPTAEFDFPSCIVRVENGTEPYVPDKRFWRKEFNRISQSQREREEPQAAAA